MYTMIQGSPIGPVTNPIIKAKNTFRHKKEASQDIISDAEILGTKLSQ